MVQPKYNPQEALERVKLMMNYDLSKTSVENKKVIEEQNQKSSDPLSCVKNYYTSENIKFEELTLDSGKKAIYVNFGNSTPSWVFFGILSDDNWIEYTNGKTAKRGTGGYGAWKCDGNSNFIIEKDNGSIHKSSNSNVQPVTQPKTDNKQDTPDPSKPQKLKPKDSPLGTTLKDTRIPKRSCVVYVNQLYEAFTRYREGFDPDRINKLREYVQRCMDDHFPSGSKQGNWGITGLGGGKTDKKLLQLSACMAPAPSQTGKDSIFRLTRKC
jgi:hypothetical protein